MGWQEKISDAVSASFVANLQMLEIYDADDVAPAKAVMGFAIAALYVAKPAAGVAAPSALIVPPSCSLGLCPALECSAGAALDTPWPGIAVFLTHNATAAAEMAVVASLDR